MLNIGDKVKINFKTINLEGLTPNTSVSGNDYWNYINEDENKVYIIKCFNNCRHAPIVLDDDFLSQTSFAFNELIKITE